MSEPSTVILACPRCGTLGASDAREKQLTCPVCACEWVRAPHRTAEQTIWHIRNLLNLNHQQDATRRNFYSSAWLLRKIATAIDAFPDPPLSESETE